MNKIMWQPKKALRPYTVFFSRLGPSRDVLNKPNLFEVPYTMFLLNTDNTFH